MIMEKAEGVCQNPKLHDDGSLYFALEDRSPDGKVWRYIDCKVEHEDGQFVLYANDSEIVRF